MAAKKPKKLISFVIPVFNEEENIAPFLVAVNAATDALANRYDFELLFTDNHSTDSTFAQLNEHAKADKRIKVIRYARNFGYQRSILTGYRSCNGDAAIQLDVDLQDPPALIAEFLAKWEDGNEVVYGVREKRDEGFFIRSARRIFYKLINWVSEVDLPVEAGDFRLVDRKVLDLLKRYDDSNPYIRGLISGIGFQQVGVPYQRARRERGSSKFSLLQYVQIAMDGFVSQSVLPLRLATYTGIGIALLTVLASFFLIVANLLFGADWPRGFATITVLILFGISLNALFLGIIGEYIARIYRQSVKQPLTVVEATIAIDPDQVDTGTH